MIQQVNRRISAWEVASSAQRWLFSLLMDMVSGFGDCGVLADSSDDPSAISLWS